MGWGDEIMVTAQARAMQGSDPRPVAVCGRDGEARWHPIWDGNPRIAPPERMARGLDAQWLDNWPGHRPYIDYAAMGGATKDKRVAWRYTDWSVRQAGAGEICLSAAERAFAAPAGRGFVVVEPLVKAGASPNKDWGRARFARLLGLLPGLDWVQLGPGGARVLAGARHVATAGFRDAGAVLARAAAYVGPEGGLHHAAAALGVPAVVIFGGMTSPANTGYAGHVNLYAGGEPCGMRLPCTHCARAMLGITPERVAIELDKLL